jgi:hypothetical protein
MIMSLTGVDEETASAAFLNHETMEDAIDSLLQKPVTQGDKYLPQKRKIETGLTPEQEERCKRGGFRIRLTLYSQSPIRKPEPHRTLWFLRYPWEILPRVSLLRCLWLRNYYRMIAGKRLNQACDPSRFRKQVHRFDMFL